MMQSKQYSSMSDVDKAKYIEDLYLKKQLSFGEIANICNTYANKIRRDAKRFNIKSRDKSEAQKNAINSGRHPHPTKGKNRSDAEKQKIGKGVLKNWQNTDEKTLAARRKKSQKLWNARSEKQKKDMLEKANKAVRRSSKEGSKLEHYLLNRLIDSGIKVDFHKEQILVNTKLQIDLFLPESNIAIEVDGPSHFAPVWGEEVLYRNKKYDQKKTGLILGRGYSLIRIKQTKDFTPARSDIIFQKLILAINNNNDKVIEIEDTDG